MRPGSPAGAAGSPSSGASGPLSQLPTSAASVAAATIQRLKTQRSLDVTCKDRREYDLWIRGLRYLIRGPPPAALLEARRQQLLIEDEHRRRVSFAVLADVTANRSATTTSVTALSEALRAGLSVTDDERASAAAAVTEAPTWDLSTALQKSIRARGDVFSWGAVGDGQCGHGDLATAYDPALPAARAAGVVAKQRPAPAPYMDALRAQARATPGAVHACEQGEPLSNSAGEWPASLNFSADARLARLRKFGKDGAHFAPGAVLAGAPLADLDSTPAKPSAQQAAQGAQARAHPRGRSVSSGFHVAEQQRQRWHWLDDLAPREAGAAHQRGRRGLTPPHAARDGRGTAAADGGPHRGPGRAVRSGAPGPAQATHAGSLQQQIPRIVGSLLGKAVKQVSCGSSHTMALTATGELYVWGAGSNGRLGLGHTRAVWKPALLTHAHVPPAPRGTLRSAGARRDTSSALPAQAGNARQPYRFVYISAGGAHSLGVSESGEVLAWGSNSAGQLGLGDAHDRLQPSFVMVHQSSTALPRWWPRHLRGSADAGTAPDSPPARQGSEWASAAATGSSSAPGFAELAELAGSAGRSRVSQLGDGYSHMSGVYTSNYLLDTGEYEAAYGSPGAGRDAPFFVAAAAGGTFSLLLDENGDVWSCGSNGCGQLGRGVLGRPAAAAQSSGAAGAPDAAASLRQRSSTHGQVPGADIALAGARSSGTQAGGRSRTWGGARPGSAKRASAVPEELEESVVTADDLPLLPPPEVIAAEWSGAQAAAEQPAQAEHEAPAAVQYGWPGAAGMLPDASAAHRFGKVMQLAGEEHRVVAVTAGLAHAGAVTEEGVAFMWGAGSCGQLGNGELQDSDVPARVEGLGKVVALSAGGAHTVAVAIDPRLDAPESDVCETAALKQPGAQPRAASALDVQLRSGAESDDSWEDEGDQGGFAIAGLGAAAPGGTAIGVPHRLCVAYAWGLAGSGQCGHIALPVGGQADGSAQELQAAAPSAPFLSTVTALGALDSLFDWDEGVLTPVSALCCAKPSPVPAPLQVQLLRLNQWLDAASAGGPLHPALQHAIAAALEAMPDVLRKLRSVQVSRRHDVMSADFSSGLAGSAGPLQPGTVAAAACTALSLDTLRTIAGFNASALALPVSTRVMSTLLSRDAIPLQGVAAVSAGHSHSALLTRGGLFMAGSGEAGQLGLKVSVPPPTAAKLLGFLAHALAARPGRPVLLQPSAHPAQGASLALPASQNEQAPCLPLDAGSVIPAAQLQAARLSELESHFQRQRASTADQQRAPRHSTLATAGTALSHSARATGGVLKRAAGSFFVPAGRAAAALAGKFGGSGPGSVEQKLSVDLQRQGSAAAAVHSAEDMLRALGLPPSARLLCVGLLTKRAAWVRATPHDALPGMRPDVLEPTRPAQRSWLSDPCRSTRTFSILTGMSRSSSVLHSHDARPVSVNLRKLADAEQTWPELLALARTRSISQAGWPAQLPEQSRMGDEDGGAVDDDDGSSSTTTMSSTSECSSQGELAVQPTPARGARVSAANKGHQLTPPLSSALSPGHAVSSIVQVRIPADHAASLALTNSSNGDVARVSALLGRQDARPRYVVTEHMLLYGVRSHVPDSDFTRWPAPGDEGAGADYTSQARADELGLLGVLPAEPRPASSLAGARPLSSYAQELLFNEAGRAADGSRMAGTPGGDAGMADVVLDDAAHALLGGRRFGLDGQPDALELAELVPMAAGHEPDLESKSSEQGTPSAARARAASTAEHARQASEGRLELAEVPKQEPLMAQASSSWLATSLPRWLALALGSPDLGAASSAWARAIQEEWARVSQRYVASLLHHGTPPKPALLQAESAARVCEAARPSPLMPALWLSGGGAAFIPPMIQGHSGRQWLPHTLLAEPVDQVLRLSSTPGDTVSAVLLEGEKEEHADADAPSKALALAGHPVVNTLGIGPVLVSTLGEKRVRAIAAGAGHTVAVVSAEWLGDAETELCMQCGNAFTFRTRRHHCRNCGGIFCADCSAKRLPLLPLGFINPVRVCDGCFDVITEDDPALLGAASSAARRTSTSSQEAAMMANLSVGASSFEWDVHA